MALIKCPECEREISDRAKACPHCGFPLDNESGGEEAKPAKTKFVAAKCPSCGASIEVNENEKRTMCNYCQSTIVVDEAIQKLQLELSGEVSVKNIPKLESMLTVAKRHYDNDEYDEAYEQYSSALLLDPNNPLIVLRKGICKSLSTSYPKLEQASAVKGFLEAMRLESIEEKKEMYVDEIIKAVFKFEGIVHNTFKSNKNVGLQTINTYFEKIEMCIDFYESIIPYIGDENKRYRCFKGIINNCNEIMRDRYYSEFNPRTGMPISHIYVNSSSLNKKIKELNKKYLPLIKEIEIKNGTYSKTGEIMSFLNKKIF